STHEIEDLGGKVYEIREKRGRIFFEGNEELIPKINYCARTLERLMILLENRNIEGLEEIYSSIKKIDFGFIKPEQSFAVRALRIGRHGFTSLDIAREAGRAVIDSYMESKNVRLKVDLDNPDIIIRVDLIHDELFVGIDTTGDDALHKRWYRIYTHHAPLNTAIASAMIKFSGWSIEKALLDPMCGGGTIPIEAAMLARNIPPGKRREFSYFAMLGKVIPDVEERAVNIKITGIDRFKKHVDGAVENAVNAGVIDAITFTQGDATQIGETQIGDIDVDTIVTNPPYGLRIGSKKSVEELYRGFLLNVKRLLDTGSTVVVITPYKQMMRRMVNELGYEIMDELWVRYGNLDTTIFKMRI
ncbi:MAG TPA: class I SAM-dependent RNA methyltransferase, partial [Thermoplasmatales archaeon]|nr:class I SAM-dependent RNA methyltransferase [Thermoplasmatales archaeon]